MTIKQLEGLVIKTTGSWHTVKTEQGLINCKFRGKLRKKDFDSTSPVAVGDNVKIEMVDDKIGVIIDILERKNCIIRQSTNLSKQTHLIASNVDYAMIMVSLVEPETPVEFIDRFLVSCEIYQVTPIVVFNKIDIYSDKQLMQMDELLEVYDKIGYEVYWISVLKRVNLDKIKNVLKDKITAIAGNSGVGKSTLLNTISPNLNLKITEVSQKYKTGKHTTTYAEMHELSFGGYIIDTPGIRAFGLNFVEKELIAQNFPEMFNLNGSCKYHNCKHIDEPDCAVKNAYDRGEIAYSRYKSYVNMMLDEDEKYRKDY